MYLDPEDSNYYPDEQEYVECELCQESLEIENCNKVIGFWVCEECQRWHIEENESVTESLMKWRKEVERRNNRAKRQLAMMDWDSLIHTIEKDFKPFVKATSTI